jgi:hypothetical protein
MKKMGILVSVLVMVIGLSVSAHATLVDMNDGTIYDTDTQLSWLKDAKYSQTSGYDADGQMTWADANTWAASLNAGSGFAGFTNWRLPTTAQPDTTCSTQSGGDSYGWNCTNSEMGHLYYTELGNAAGGPLTNTGPFTNVQASLYWSGTEYAPNPSNAWVFHFTNGHQVNLNKADFLFAWAVRPGVRLVGGGGTPVGYSPAWLFITLVSLTGVGGYLLRRRMERQ